jgi:hypothetical protein
MISITNGVLTATVSVLLDKAAQTGVDSSLQAAIEAAVHQELRRPEHRKALAAIARKLVQAEIDGMLGKSPVPEAPKLVLAQPSPYSSSELPDMQARHNVMADFEGNQAAAALKVFKKG